MPLKDNYIIGLDAPQLVAFDADDETQNGWIIPAQTFTAASSYTLESIKVKLYRDTDDEPFGSNPVAVLIWPVSGGFPDTDMLDNTKLLATSQPESWYDITTDTDGDWYEFTFTGDDAIEIVSGTAYAIMVWNQLSEPYHDVGGVYWFADTSSATFAAGKGVVYNLFEWRDYVGTVDFGFEVWSAYVFTPPTSGPTTKRLIAVAKDTLWYEDI